MSNEPVSKLEKIGNNKFRLTTTFDRLVRVEEFDKSFLRESYDVGMKDYNDLLEQLKKVNKKIEENTLTLSEEEEIVRFIEINNKAHKYSENKKAIDQRVSLLEMIKNHVRQKEDIERVCPEFKRLKK